jgi:hypothetical protein
MASGSIAPLVSGLDTELSLPASEMEVEIRGGYKIDIVGRLAVEFDEDGART